MTTAVQVAAQLHSADEQRELFLWKYRDIKREDVADLLKVRSFSYCWFNQIMMLSFLSLYISYFLMLNRRFSSVLYWISLGLQKV